MQLQILKYRVLEVSEKSFKLEGDDFQHMPRKVFFKKKHMLYSGSPTLK